MYIALKWLLGMVLTMWIALCSLDIYRNKDLTKHLECDLQKHFIPVYNKTSFIAQQNIYDIEGIKIPNENPHDDIYFQYLLFLAGICVISIFNRKNDIIMFTKEKVNNFNFDTMNEVLQKILRFKKTAKLNSFAVLKYVITVLTGLLKTNRRDIRLMLVNKLKELSQKRINLGELLTTSVQKNKKERMHSIEAEVKNKLLLFHNVVSQRQIIENRSRNFSFQQLYLVTHQENIFLKSRLKTLTKEKDDAERKLIKLINQICQSKNNDFKSYCSQFVVHTENNLLNSDVTAEINKFLQQSSDVKHSQESNQFSEETIHHGNFDNLCIKPIKFIDNENLIAIVENAPKCRGLSREYVWTVKDKNGIIKKVYECGSDCDKGDAIRRIRQYSVYYDTECLLDFSDSTTFNADVFNLGNEFTNIKLTITNRRFLSSSQAFKNFLENSKSVVAQHLRS